MFVTQLVSLLCLLGRSRVPLSNSWYMCNSSIDGEGACTGKGMAAYVSYGATNPPRPSVFYPVSSTTYWFTQSFVSTVLGVSASQQSVVSAKYSGIFVPRETGDYTFTLNVKHVYDDRVALRFDYASSCSGLIDMDLTEGGTAYNGECTGVSDASDWCYIVNGKANCLRVTKKFSLTAGKKYPLFGGLNSTAGVPYGESVYVDLKYTSPSGKGSYVTDYDAVVSPDAGLPNVDESDVGSSDTESTEIESPGADVSGGSTSGTSNSSGSNASKSNATLIGAVAGGSILIIIIVAVTLWIVLRKRRSTDGARRNSRSRGQDGARRGGVDRHRGGSGHHRHHRKGGRV